MTYTIEKKDLFTLPKKEWVFAHCISLDCKMGAGIAVKMKKEFHLNALDKVVDMQELKVPTTLFHNNVFNLITKKKYHHKPTYETMEGALKSMRQQAKTLGIKKIAMPKIGSGLDRLSWPLVEAMIKDIFKDEDVEILVCSWS